MSAELMKTVEQLNGKVASLNNERSRQLGMQEAAKDQYAKAIQAYEMKYGVKLTEANLQEEYNKVYAETKGNVLALQTAIESIERGDYKNVERPADIDLEPNVEVKQPEPKVAPQLTADSIKDATGVVNTDNTGRTPIDYAALNAGASQQVVPNLGGVSFGGYDEEDTDSAPVKTQENPINFGGFGEATQPVVTPVSFTAPETKVEGNSVPDDEEESFTPAGWGSADTDINKNFADILNPSGIKFGE